MDSTPDNWDAEPSDVSPVSSFSVIKNKNKWEGEDIEEDVADSWDQEEPEVPKEEKEAPKSATTSKKNLKKIGEKFEEKKKKQVATKGSDTETQKQMTAEEILEDKLKRQKLQEESDLRLAKEVFGVLGSTGFETKEDYDKFKDEFVKLLNDCVKNTNFYNFTEEVVHSLCVHLPSMEIKKVHTWLGNLHIEKSKLEKGEKSKKSKGKGKAKLKLEGDNDYSEYSAYAEDFDDII